MTRGERIRQEREARGLSQDDLGKLAGCSQQNVAHLETDRYKRSKFLLPIATALELNPHWAETEQGEKYIADQSSRSVRLDPQMLARALDIAVLAFKANRRKPNSLGLAAAAIEAYGRLVAGEPERSVRVAVSRKLDELASVGRTGEGKGKWNLRTKLRAS